MREAETGRHGGSRLVWLVVALTVLAAIAVWVVSTRAALERLESNLGQTLILAEHNITSEIARFRYLPLILGEDERIRSLIEDSENDVLRIRAERYLEAVANETDASFLYLLNDQGLTLAASNWQAPNALTGINYGFRPYFLEAMVQGVGRTYAIGVTTGLPGYFLARRFRLPSGTTGVVVAKVELDALEKAWREADAQIAVADADGIVFLSGTPSWKYRSLQALPEAALQRLTRQRTYHGFNPGAGEPLLAGREDLARQPSRTHSLRGAPTQMLAMRTVPSENWTLLAARDSQTVLTTARFWTTITALSGLLLAGGLHLFFQRRVLVRLRVDQNRILEQKVAERTDALAREVQTRIDAEAALRQAQEGLVHAGKMAALGRMSAAIVHEISQPLAAMDNTLASASLHAARDDRERLEGRLGAARKLVDRMRRMVAQLRAFSRRESHVLEEVDCDACVRTALELAASRLESGDIVPSFEVIGPQVSVSAVALKVEQILLNLILNALDALEGQACPQFRIRRQTNDETVQVSVIDNGKGISAGMLEQVKEPFYTTRQTGEGLGLGLAISSAMAQEFGGYLELRQGPEGGAVATLTLPRKRGPLVTGSETCEALA